MSKFQKLFGLSLLMFAVSFFMVACEDSEKDPDPESEDQTLYNVKINGGSIYFEDENGDEIVVLDGDNGDFYANDTLTVLALSANEIPGQEFVRWTVTPSTYNSYFLRYSDGGNDRDSAYAYFRMPAANITITAEYRNIYIPEDGVAYVRFVWERDWQPEIDYIYAGAVGIQWWKEEIFADTTLDSDYFDFRSSWSEALGGIPGIPTIFEFPDEDDDGDLLPFDDSNHGVEFEVPAGTYMAVCAVYDTTLEVTWDIIANYNITINEATATRDGDDTFFELGFWLSNFFASPSDVGFVENPEKPGYGTGWYALEYDGVADPRLEKRRKATAKKTATQTIVKAGATMEVTYYAFPRAKSKARS